MKKSLLLISSFLMAAAIVQAKEITPAPVAVNEAPVKVVEKEVIVYRDRAPVGFKPNGNMKLEYRYYGDAEGQNHDTGWSRENNYSRIQFSGTINVTENQRFYWRIRDWNSLDKESDRRTENTNTQVRLRYFYDHGYLGDSKVNFTSRVHYQDGADNVQKLEYSTRFNFAEYMFNNDYAKVTNFILAPKYAYAWGGTNDNDYDNQLGMDLFASAEFPLGFSFELNVYTAKHFYGRDRLFDGNRKLEDENFTVDVEAYLYNTQNLYTSADGKLGIDFGFEGGYDDYSWSQEKTYGSSRRDNVDYSLYALPYIQVNYQVSPNFKAFVAAGAEYRNFAVTSGKSASHWRWQPEAWAGFNVTF